MKKLVSVLLALALSCVLLVGCASAPASSAVTSAGSTAKSEATGEKPVLTVWSWDKTFNGLAIEEAAKLYDGATVNFVEMAKGDCLKKIHTVLASGVTTDLPDIVSIGDLSAQGYLMSYPGAFMPMDDVINYNDFASYKKASVSYDGVGYGVPFDTGVAGLFYRTDYIEEIGMTAEDMQNLTWDEYLAMGEKLKAKGHALQTFNPDDIAEFQIMLQSTGKWFTKADGTADFTQNDALKECFGIFKTLNDSDYVKTVSDWTEFAGAINGGDVACVLRGSWISSTILAGEDQSGKWAVAPVPSMKSAGATNYSNQGGSSWYVLQNGKNAAVAADFLAKTFGGSTELYNTMLEQKNILGSYLPAAEVPALATASEFYGGQKVNADLTQWVAKIPPVDTGAYSTEAQAALKAVTPDILAGGDLDAALATAEAQFNQSIQ